MKLKFHKMTYNYKRYNLEFDDGSLITNIDTDNFTTIIPHMIFVPCHCRHKFPLFECDCCFCLDFDITRTGDELYLQYTYNDKPAQENMNDIENNNITMNTTNCFPSLFCGILPFCEREQLVRIKTTYY